MVGCHERRMATPLYNTHKSKDYKKKEEKKKKKKKKKEVLFEVNI